MLKKVIVSFVFSLCLITGILLGSKSVFAENYFGEGTEVVAVEEWESRAMAPEIEFNKPYYSNTTGYVKKSVKKDCFLKQDNQGVRSNFSIYDEREDGVSIDSKLYSGNTYYFWVKQGETFTIGSLEDDYGDEKSAAVMINTNELIEANLAHGEDVDYFKFIADRTGQSYIWVNNKSEDRYPIVLNLFFYDSGRGVGSVQAEKLTDNGMDVNLQEGTTYVIGVTNYIEGGGFQSAKDYSVYILTNRIEQLKLDKKKIELKAKKTAKLQASYSPEVVLNSNLLWSSSNPSVATVNQDGLVYAKSTGKATITCMAEDNESIFDICKVTVKGKKVKKASIGKITKITFKNAPSSYYQKYQGDGEVKVISWNKVKNVDGYKLVVKGKLSENEYFTQVDEKIKKNKYYLDVGTDEVPKGFYTISVTPYKNVGGKIVYGATKTVKK